MIEYNGKQYKTRKLYVDKNRGEVIIAELALDEAIGPIKSKEGRKVDDQICYYADEKEFEMPDDEMRQMLFGPLKK